ncbi:MAG: PBP1A family penicillin-binding protein [Acidobacteria bacterium]|nr:MAG: PBP1A family penicillin-binding protein [Acidobacteriota bacterium]
MIRLSRQTGSRRPTRFIIRLSLGPHWRGWLAATLAAWVLAAAAGLGTASLLRQDLPQVQSLEDYAPPVLSRIYAGDESLLRQFGEQRRLVVGLNAISPWFRQAIVASEDSHFFTHPGVDLKAILRAVWADLLAGRKAQGASTITQQLAKDLFLTREKLWTRKLQEWVFALQMEKTYTKEEILALYCNQIYFGHGFYGIEAASRFYYDRSAAALTLDQAALLAGLVQRPNTYSPVRFPERARRRRDVVLRRMVSEGFITSAQAEAAQARAVVTHADAGAGSPHGLYFIEEVRKRLIAQFGEEALYQDGLEVATTMDPGLQKMVEEMLRDGLRTVDRRRGFRPVTENVLDDHGTEPEAWNDPTWSLLPSVGRAVYGVVLESAREKVRVRLGPDMEGVLDAGDALWTGEKDLRRLLKRGDRTLFTPLADPPADGGPVPVSLDQVPLVEGAVVILDPASGEVLALAGGYDYERSQFNRAIQARRQVGSAFKPLLYAAALEAGLTPADRIYDHPTVFIDPQTGNLYQPENYERDYMGLMTLRTALEHSRNIPAVKLINHIGFRPVFDLARRLGITTRLRPYPSLALGAVEVSLLEMTAAYGAFANGGLLLPPHLIRRVTDRDGKVRLAAAPAATEAVEPGVAYVLTQMLQGVIRRGTGASIADFPYPAAGKTGTTDAHTDAWFIGYTPSLVCGVWVGLDQSASLGFQQSGARAALPIWDRIMRAAMKGRPTAEFARPPEVSQAPVDPLTGSRAGVRSDCREVLLESFLPGTEPTTLCGRGLHFRQQLPYFLHMLPLDENQRLVLSREELDTLRDEEARYLRWLPLSHSLAITYGDTSLTVGVRLRDAGPFASWGRWRAPQPPGQIPQGPLLQVEDDPVPEDLPEPPEDVLSLVERRGLDGRRPQVVIIRADR